MKGKGRSDDEGEKGGMKKERKTAPRRKGGGKESSECSAVVAERNVHTWDEMKEKRRGPLRGGGKEERNHARREGE